MFWLFEHFFKQGHIYGWNRWFVIRIGHQLLTVMRTLPFGYIFFYFNLRIIWGEWCLILLKISLWSEPGARGKLSRRGTETSRGLLPTFIVERLLCWSNSVKLNIDQFWKVRGIKRIDCIIFDPSPTIQYQYPLRMNSNNSNLPGHFQHSG